MAYIGGGYANRAMSTIMRNEYQERPEEESWHREFNLPFSPKRPASQVFDNQGYPVKRPRSGSGVSQQYGMQNQIHVGMNGNINAQRSLHLPAPPNLPHEQARHGPVQPQLNLAQSMQYHQTGPQSNSMGAQPRLPLISHLASQMQTNHAISHQPYPQRNHMSPPRLSPYTESARRQSEVGNYLAQPFSPGQNISRQEFQSQASRGNRASSFALSQGQADIRKGMALATPRYQSVPPSPATQEPGSGSFRHSLQPSPQKPQPLRERQKLSQGFQASAEGFQPSPMQTRPNTILQNDLHPRGQTNFAHELNIPKLPIVKRNGPFIIDDDEDEMQHSESLTINTEIRSNPIPASQTKVPAINFAQGRRGARPLTHGLVDPPDQKTGADSQSGKSKSNAKCSKKTGGDAASGEIKKQAEAYAKIKEKQDMAAKANSTDALFEEPVNEAAQARINASKQKEEIRKREIEARKKYKQAMAEEIEKIKKEAAESEKAQREAERASRKSKTQGEREEMEKAREEEENKRHEEQKRKADELLSRKREEQSEREAAAREKEAVAETKRQQDAETLKKALEASKVAAISLKPAKKGQVGREESGGRTTAAAIKQPKPPVDDGGLFVPEQVVVEPPDEATPDRSAQPRGDTQRPPLTPTSPPNSNSTPNSRKPTTNTEQKVPHIAATIQEIPGSEDISLRALAGWRGARKANTETKVASIVIEHHKEKLMAEQKLRDEALAQERAREKTELMEGFSTLFERLSSTLTAQVKGELKTAVEKVLNVRPPIMPTTSRAVLNQAKGNTVSPKKYASETQCFLERKTTKQPKDIAAPGEKSLSDSDARKREKEEVRLAEKARKRFEVKLHRDNAEQSRPMSEYEFRSLIERQVKEYREKREKKFEKERRMMPHGGESSQGRVRFGYEDIDFNDANSSQPNKSSPQSEKGRSGGIMARLRDSNGSLGYFQDAAGAKAVDRGVHRLEGDTDTESDISEEDPDDDEPDIATIARPEIAEPLDRVDCADDISVTEADGTMAHTNRFGFGNKTTHLVKPRHLQDKEMIYIFSVQRSEIRNEEQSLPISLKQFFDRNDANDFAEEELRRTRWGPSMARPQITQFYSQDMGLFSGRAVIDTKENVVECVDVVAQAQYIGDLDDFDHARVKVIFKPKTYFIFKSTTRRVQRSTMSYDETTSETEPNAEINRNGEMEQAMEIDQNIEEAQTLEEGQSEGAVDQNTNGKTDDRKSESSDESGGDAIDALFEEEAGFEDSDDPGHDLGANAHQLSLDTEMTCTPLEAYTDRELANKRASEIFLAAIRPVGGDISRLIAFQNDAEKPVRESLESYNKSGELFFGSNDNENSGEEFRSRQTPQIARVSRSFTTTRYSRASPRNPDAAATSPLKATAPSTEPNSSASATAESESGQTSKLAADGLAALNKTAEQYSAYGVAEVLYRQCAAQADYKIPQAAMEDEEMPKTADGEDLGEGAGWWHNELGLKPTFSTWSQVTMLHMYLLTVRLRCFPASTSSIYQQHLIDHFFYDAEHRMVVSHNMEARGTRNKYLKDLFIQWRGILFAYDEGLVRGDAALASAVWRNVWKGEEDVDIKGLTKVIAYMRKSLMDLEATEELDMQMGKWKWSDPDAMKVLVGKKSPMMDKPFIENTEAVGGTKSV
ncbi:hypothetical protein V492_07099 [Pseudogymnoascus sp. VKM F-4246]|nr:hypothetical protein V492_07099 [Pseudogymnoascus sp. VKM F-4246]